jgi:GntR family transcriptional repressor for pyruvate dehydrogenase complex
MEAQFQPISRTTMSEDIIRMIFEMINSGKLKPGDKLPSERDLMEQLQVSRSPVREALRSLSIVGLLDTVPGGGTYVSKALAADFITEQLEWSRLLTEPEIVELIDVRDPLEIQAAGLAALRATAEDIARLREAIDRYLMAHDDASAAVEADHNFHQIIGEMTHNRLLVQLSQIIRDIWKKYHEEDRLQFSLSSTLNQDYLEVLAAIEDGDEIRARKAMEEHLGHSRQISYMSKAINTKTDDA